MTLQQFYDPQFSEPEQQHTGMLVALWLDGKAAQQLAYKEDPAELHITLWYDPEAEPEDFTDVVAAVRRAMHGYEPLDGAVNGLGRFYGGAKDVFWAKPDIRGIHNLREEIVAAIGRDPSQFEFSPHITLAYLEKGELLAFSEEPMEFMAPGQPRDRLGRWARFGGRSDLDPLGGIREGAAVGYQGGIAPFTGGELSNKHLSPENESKRETPVDTDLIVALREYNRTLPSTHAIPDDAEVWYDNKVMTRGEMRQQIVNEFLEGKHDTGFDGYATEKVMDIYMGPPAAGKSGAVKAKSGTKYIEIDSDRVKEKLPEFHDGKNANGVHEESASINHEILQAALQRGYKIALPIVGKSPGSVNEAINNAIANGYKVNVHLVHADARSISTRMVDRIDQTGRFVDPTYYLGSSKFPDRPKVGEGPADVFRSIRNDPRISNTSVWDTSFREGAPYGFPAAQRSAATFAEVEPGAGRSMDVRRGATGVADGQGPRDGSDGGLAPLEAPYYEFRAVPLHFNGITIKCGDAVAFLPFGADVDEVYDMSETIDVPYDHEEWSRERLQRFAEWLGYNIEPNPDSVLGFRVTSPSGKALGGFVASRIIEGWQKNPNLTIDGAGGEKPKKKGGKGGGASKTPEQKAAEKAAKAAEQFAAAQQKAAEALEAVDPAVMESKSKGKLSATDLASFKARAEAKIAAATDAKGVRDAVREMKAEIAKYKRELLKPPTLDQQLADTKAKLRENLPSATRLAGTTYDENQIQKLIDKHVGDIESASTTDAAKAAVNAMRNAIADYKLAEQKAKKDAAAAKKAAVSSGSGKGQPRTASEWAAFYNDQFLGPEDSESEDGED